MSDDESRHTAAAIETINSVHNGDGTGEPATPINEADLKASSWPWHGGVQFKNVSMRYDVSSPLVLKNMSLTIPPGGTLGTPYHSPLCVVLASSITQLTIGFSL